MKRIHSPIRVYADTSVFGGVFDDAFSVASRRFFESVQSGRLKLIISAVVRDELLAAPRKVANFFEEMERGAEIAEIGEEAHALQQAYLRAGIVGPQSMADALHVAAAVTSGCRIIVSWNFKHIVHYAKIPLYNGVNLAQGFSPIAIHSPMEIITDEKE